MTLHEKIAAALPFAGHSDAEPEPPRWRIGRHYGIHVYCGDTPIATFHTVADAQAAVRAYNASLDRQGAATGAEVNMATRRAHSVEFYSPGTFLAEVTTQPIESWSVMEAIALSRAVVERYGAKPWGFRFLTHIVGSDVDDGEGGKLRIEPKEVERSVLYFLGGIVQTVADLEAEKDPRLDILISNMRCNGWPCVVRNSNSWLTYQPFTDSARLLNVTTGKVIAEAPPPAPSKEPPP